MSKESLINQSYEAAKALYASYGVDADQAMAQLSKIEVSMHCWQGDDVTGLEAIGSGAAGGILSTGNYPGKPRNGAELRADIDKALSLMPGRQRLNLHASYAELNGEQVDRDAYRTEHFSNWIEWAKKNDVALDFNPSCFGHPMAADNLTLANPDEKIRRFWIDHCKASRRISADFGRILGKTCITNIWVPDGLKDFPADRTYYRQLLRDSLDEILSTPYNTEYLLDAVECKLFGIGVEAYTVGSHEFYMAYVSDQMRKGNEDLILTLDMGHFQPTETIADKISALLLFNKRLLVHVSRPMGWDSDHVVLTDDRLLEAIREIKRANAFDRVFLATDFFDGSINRITAWVTGVRATQRAVLAALLEPTDLLKQAERERRFSDRLAMTDEFRNLPVASIWDKYCLDQGAPTGLDWLKDVNEYERGVMAGRA